MKIFCRIYLDNKGQFQPSAITQVRNVHINTSPITQEPVPREERNDIQVIDLVLEGVKEKIKASQIQTLLSVNGNRLKIDKSLADFKVDTIRRVNPNNQDDKREGQTENPIHSRNTQLEVEVV